MATTTKPRPRPKAKGKATQVATKTKAASKTSTAKTKAAPKAKAKAAPKTATKAKTAKTSTKTKAKAPATKVESNGVGRELNLHGFVPNSDSALIVQALIEGGAERGDVNTRATELIEKTNGLATRSGKEKNIPSLTAAILTRLREKGYTIEANWRVVPPKDIEDAMKKEATAAKRRATRAAKAKK